MYFDGSDQEWSRQLDQLETKGFYENECGDLMLPALAHNFGVDIFVINTSRGSTPFSPISSSVWGGKQTNKPPLLLAYDGDHVEPLLPATPHDSQLTIELMQSWKVGDFNVTLASLKTRQGSHSAEQKKKPFEQVSTDRVESAASAGDMRVKNEQAWTTVEKGGKKKKAELVSTRKEFNKPRFENLLELRRLIVNLLSPQWHLCPRHWVCQIGHNWLRLPPELQNVRDFED